MGIDGCITGSASQILVLAVRDMQMSLRVTVLLCETKINDIDLVATLADTHQEVVWFDVTMNEIFGMNVFDTGDLKKEKKKEKKGGLY